MLAPLEKAVESTFGRVLSKCGARKEFYKYDDKNFGNELLVFSCARFVLRFVQDRGGHHVEIRSTVQDSPWFSLDRLIKILLDEEIPERDLARELPQLAVMFEKNMDSISAMLSPENIEQTSITYKRIIKERLKRFYPYGRLEE